MSNPIASSTAIDLSRLPAPDLIETLDFEEILAAHIADLVARAPEFDALVESDPAMKILQVTAFRELLLRQRVNEASRANMIASAAGGDLDNLAALFGVVRQVVTEADPETDVEEALESDTDFRRRVLLAPDSYSVAGPATAYVFHALSASGTVLDASATSPEPGEVVVWLLGRDGDGTADPASITAVEAVLTDDVRPLTDAVTVQSATIVPFEVTASLHLYPGPDSALILQTAVDALTVLLENQRRIGRDVTLSALYAALHVEGVQRAELISPAESIVVDNTQAAHATGIAVTIAGYDE